MNSAMNSLQSIGQASGAPVPPGCDSLAKLFVHRVAERGEITAICDKRHGIWQSISWREYGARARAIDMGLAALGMRPGDVVNILAESVPEWLFADMGAICAGCVSVGIYPTSSRDQVRYIVNDSGARVIFVEDEEQLDKVLERRAEMPALVRIIVFDMDGLHHFSDPMVMSLDDLAALGRDHDAAHPQAWAAGVAAAQPAHAAIIVYTSGTTGPPKGALISHANMLFAIERWSEFAPTHARDDTLAFLPLCHMAERLFSAMRPLGYGGVIYFVESPDAVLENLQEVQPTVFLAVPRIWEKLYSLVSVSQEEATPLERWVYQKALAVAYRVADCRMAHREPGPGLRFAYRIADLLVLRNTRKLIGLNRARLIGSGAAPISRELMRWYVALGLNMFELYGQTECTGVATYYRPSEFLLGTVGRALAGTDVAIAADGEILMRGPHIFMGYHNQPEKTAAAIKDGWLHTGDVGNLDESGCLRITDRKSDIIITSAGKNITPSEIENRLKFSTYITDAIVIGDRRNYLTALVMIDQENVERYAQKNRILFTDYASLTRAADIKTLLWNEVNRVNQTLASVEQIKKIRLLDILLTAEDEEMTPTLKLRRKYVNDKYRAEIDAMYAEGVKV